MQSIVSSLALAALASAVAAQGRSVFPSDHRSYEGSSYQTGNPLSGGVRRTQFVYDRSDLTVPQGRSITALGFRQDGDWALPSGFQVQLEIRMGHTELALDKVSTTFTENYAAPPVTVLARKIVALPAFAKPTVAPSTGWAMIALDQKFAVDSTRNLVVEWVTWANSNQNRPFSYYLDLATFAAPRTSFGTGCRGSNNRVPVLTDQGGRTGASWSVQGTDLPNSAPVVWAIGLSKDKLAHSIPLPLALGGFGAPGCSVYVDLLLTLITTATASGSISFFVPIPRSDSLYGTPLYHQALAYDPFANSFGFVFTAGHSMQIGRSPLVTTILEPNSATGTIGTRYTGDSGIPVAAFDHD